MLIAIAYNSLCIDLPFNSLYQFVRKLKVITQWKGHGKVLKILLKLNPLVNIDVAQIKGPIELGYRPFTS